MSILCVAASIMLSYLFLFALIMIPSVLNRHRSVNGMDDANEIIKELGRKPSVLLSQCNSDVAALRNSIISAAQLIVLANNSVGSYYENFDIPFPYGYTSFIFNPPELPTFLGFAQLTQNTGFLLSYITEHPDKLADAVLNQTKKPFFDYLIRCAVPAAFGFFSAKEHLDIAIHFYERVADTAEPKLASNIFFPLLHSACTNRFLEATFQSFIEQILFDVSFILAPKKEQYLKEYTHYFTDCIVNSLPLLPQSILSLFNRLRRNKWPENSFCKLFFTNFLWEAAERWILTSPGKEYREIMQKIMLNASTNKVLKEKIYKRLFSCHSLYQLPLMFTVFGHQYLSYSLRVHDIHILGKALTNSKLMPDTVTLTELQRVPRQFELHWYACQVYPRLKAFKRIIKEEALFPCKASHELAIFEKLLIHRMYQSELIKWNTDVQKHHYRIVTPFIEKMTKLDLKLPFPNMIATIVSRLNLPTLKKTIYLHLVDTNLQKWIGKYLPVLKKLDIEFVKLLGRLDQFSNVPLYTEIRAKFPQSIKRIFQDTLMQLACIDRARLSSRFFTILNAFDQLEYILQITNLGDNAFPALLKQNPGTRLLSSFMILNIFAMQNTDFFTLCNEKQTYIWLKVQTAILTCLNLDKVFLTAYVNLHSEFSKMASMFLK